MSCYTPKRKTANGIEEVKIPIGSVNGLEEKLSSFNKGSLTMPIIRVASVFDKDGTMVISKTNPLKFAVEIIEGALKVGDVVQICTRELSTYSDRNKRKYKLRCLWSKKIDDKNVSDRFIFVEIAEGFHDGSQRLYKTNDTGNKTFSPLYIRVRRPIFSKGVDVDGNFSNIITVWKKYNMTTGRITIK